MDTSIATSKKAHKCLRRLMEYAVETGLRDDNPALRMNVAHPPDREVVWHVPHLEKIIEDTFEGGVATSGNLIPPRPSLAIAISIAYDTGQRAGDVISLTWPQYDGEGLTVKQKKRNAAKKKI